MADKSINLFKRFPRYPPSNYSSSCHKDPLKCQVYKSSPQRKTVVLNVKINTAIIIWSKRQNMWCDGLSWINVTGWICVCIPRKAEVCWFTLLTFSIFIFLSQDGLVTSQYKTHLWFYCGNLVHFELSFLKHGAQKFMNYPEGALKVTVETQECMCVCVCVAGLIAD